MRDARLGNELQRLRDPNARAVSVALKGRGSLLLGGHLGAAYFFSDQTGRMTTSTYYRAALPEWAERWNGRKPADAVFGKAWERLLPADLKPRIASFLTRFTTHTAPALANLPRQVIHGDFNPHNLLADPADPTQLTGLLDFGDMTLSHRICDLAVAASYLVEPADPAILLAPLTRTQAGMPRATTPLVTTRKMSVGAPPLIQAVSVRFGPMLPPPLAW